MAAVHVIPGSPEVARTVGGRNPPCARVRIMPPGPPYVPKYRGNMTGLYVWCIPDTLRSVTLNIGGRDTFTVLAEDLCGKTNVLDSVVVDPPGGVLLTKDAVHHTDVLVFAYDLDGVDPVAVERRPVPFTRPLEWTDIESYDVMLPRVEVHYDGEPARPFTLRNPGPPTLCTFYETRGVTNVLRVQCGFAHKNAT